MDNTGDGSDDGVDTRQLLLVSLCLFGLVAASFLAPVTGSNDPIGSGSSDFVTGLLSDILDFLFGQDETPEREPANRDGGEGGGGDGGGPSLPDWLIDILRHIPFLFDGSGEGENRESRCQVVVESDPTPGTETTVRVSVDDQPAEDVRVWFNDRFVGRTNEAGTVAGDVPYVDELNVTVASPVEEPCAFSRQPAVGKRQSESPLLGSVVAVSGIQEATFGAGRLSATRGQLPRIASASGAVSQTAPEGDGRTNSSSEIPVNGDATVSVDGEPYPNSTVRIIATVGRTPIPGANVTVDGQRVGETDAAGGYTLTLPDRDRIDVAVARGSVSGRESIDIWQLEIGFVPQLVVPGETVTANVTTSAGPVEGATMTSGDRRLGTTGPDGRIQFTSPMAVDGTVTAATERQTTSAPLVAIYAYTLGASFLLVVFSTVSTAIAARRYGRDTAKRVAIGWAGIGALLVVFAIWEVRGLAGAATGLALVGLYRYRQAVRSGSVSTANAVAAALDRCRRAALSVVFALERLLDWVGIWLMKLVAWLRSLPRSVSALAARLRAWLRSVRRRLVATALGLSARAAAVLALAVGFVGGATYLLGVRGLVLSSGLVVLVGASVWAYHKRGSDDSSGEAASTDDSAETDSTADDPSDPTLRQLWRRLARWVVPTTYRTRTPAEVSRAAIERGLPREPVEALTEAFRDVEYGGQSSTSRLEQAWEAFEALERSRDEEETEQ